METSGLVTGIILLSAIIHLDEDGDHHSAWILFASRFLSMSNARRVWCPVNLKMSNVEAEMNDAKKMSALRILYGGFFSLSASATGKNKNKYLDPMSR